MPQPTAATAAPATAPSFGDRVLQYFRDFRVLRETRAEYWGIQLVNLIDCVMYFGLLNIASVFLSENVGLNDEQAGYSVALFTTATTIFLFFSGTVTDWLGIRLSTHIAMLAQGALRLGVALVGLLPWLPHRGLLATVLLLLMAPFMAMIQTVFQAANKRFTTERSRSAGYSLWYLVMNIGAAGGGFLIDIVRKWLGWSNAHVFTIGAVARAGLLRRSPGSPSTASSSSTWRGTAPSRGPAPARGRAPPGPAERTEPAPDRAGGGPGADPLAAGRPHRPHPGRPRRLRLPVPAHAQVLAAHHRRGRGHGDAPGHQPHPDRVSASSSSSRWSAGSGCSRCWCTAR